MIFEHALVLSAYLFSIGIYGCVFGDLNGRWINIFMRNLGSSDVVMSELWGLAIALQLA